MTQKIRLPPKTTSKTNAQIAVAIANDLPPPVIEEMQCLPTIVLRFFHTIYYWLYCYSKHAVTDFMISAALQHRIALLHVHVRFFCSCKIMMAPSS